MECGTSEEWDEYKAQSKLKAPFTYWLTNTAFDKIQSWIFTPYDIINSVRYWSLNKFSRQYHKLDTKLPAEYYDLDTRYLHAAFEAFVDYVEIEKAWMMIFCVNEAKDKYNLPWHQRYKLTRWNTWRCAEAGLAYLNLEINQSENDDKSRDAAILQLELYNWWKARKNPQDPYKEAHDFYELASEVYGRGGFRNEGKWPNQVVDQYHELLSKAANAVQVQYDTDTAMLTKLIGIRQYLWT